MKLSDTMNHLGVNARERRPSLMHVAQRFFLILILVVPLNSTTKIVHVLLFLMFDTFTLPRNKGSISMTH